MAFQLDAAFEHAEEEIVCGSDSFVYVAGYVAWTYDGAPKATFAGFAD